MGLVWTTLLNGMLGLAGYLTARHAFREPSGLTRGLAAATLAWTWATVGLEALGAAGWLSLGPLFVWTAIGLAIGLGLRSRDRKPAAVESPGPPAAARWSWEAITALGMVIWVALLYGVPSLLLAVKVVSDGPIYHLYFAARWWKEGRLSLIATPFGETAATYFPAVGDLWFTWLMAGWGSERLAKVGQLPFWAASAMTVYALARRLGASGSSAVVAAAWFATSAPLLLFAFEPNVDMIFVAGYLVAVLGFVRYALGETHWGTLAIGALAAGGALGTKAIGVVFVPPLLVLAAVAVIARKASRAETLRHLLIIALAPMVMAGFWYGRNALLTGNPLYPLHFEVGGRVWLAGWYGPDAMRQSQYYIPRGDWRALGDILLAVLDPHLAPVWLAAVVGLWAVGTPRSPERRAAAWCAALAVLNVALYWVLIPYRTQQRFMLQGLGLAAVPLALLLDRGRWIRIAAVALLALHLLVPGSWPFPPGGAPWNQSTLIPESSAGLVYLPRVDLWPAASPTEGAIVGLVALVILGVLAMAVAWMWARAGPPWSRGRPVRAALASALLAGLAVAVFYPRRLDPRIGFYPPFRDYYAGWLDLESRVGPAGARIAYAGTNIPYYLLGAGLRNEVRYVNIDGHRGWLLHDYHREAKAKGRPTWPGPRPGWDRLNPDYDAWLANLREEQIEVLVVARANPVEGAFNLADSEHFPIERLWADAHPETFECIYGPAQGDRLLRIYRVHGLRLAAPRR